MNVFKRCVAQVLAMVFLAASLAAPAQAALLSTEDLLADAQRQELRATVMTDLARAEVQDQLMAWGVSAEQAVERLDHLSDAELLAFAAQVEDLPAGGIAGALGIVFVVLLVLELVGVIDIFKAI